MYKTRVQKIFMLITILLLGFNAYEYSIKRLEGVLPYDRFIFMIICLISILSFRLCEKRQIYGFTGALSIIRFLLSLYIIFNGFLDIGSQTVSIKNFGAETFFIGFIILILQIITAIKTRKQHKMFNNDIMFM